MWNLNLHCIICVVCLAQLLLRSHLGNKNAHSVVSLFFHVCHINRMDVYLQSHNSRLRSHQWSVFDPPGLCGTSVYLCIALTSNTTGVDMSCVLV